MIALPEWLCCVLCWTLDLCLGLLFCWKLGVF